MSTAAALHEPSHYFKATANPVSLLSSAAAYTAALFLFRERLAQLSHQNNSIEYFVLATSMFVLLAGSRTAVFTTQLRDLVAGMAVLLTGISGLILLDAWKRPLISSTPFLLALTTLGILWTLFGAREARRQAFPISYLLLMTPLPVVLVVRVDLPLQILSAELARRATKLLGIAAERWGTTVRLPHSELSLRIIGDCDGLHSAVAMAAIALLLGWLLHASLAKRLLLLCAGLLLAYAGNILRLTTILVLLHRYGQRFAGFLPHFDSWYGAFIFALTTGLLLVTARCLGCVQFREI